MWGTPFTTQRSHFTRNLYQLVCLALLLASCTFAPGNQGETPSTSGPSSTPVIIVVTATPGPTATRVPRTVFVRPTLLSEGATREAELTAQAGQSGSTQVAGLSPPSQTVENPSASATPFVVTPTFTSIPASSTPAPSATFAPGVTPPTATRTATATATTQAQPTLPGPRLYHIKFITDQNGWALADGYVLRTVNGGRNWNEASPLPLASNEILEGFFLDSLTAWVLRTTAPTPTESVGTLYRTSDGGQVWRATTMPAPTGLLYFTDSQNGWFMATFESTTEMAVEIYRTTDSGVTWDFLSASFSSFPPPENNLPDYGFKNSIFFSDLNRGWVSGTISDENTPYLYRSPDGGLQWNSQTLTVPAEFSSPTFITYAPYFYPSTTGVANGVLPVKVSTNSSSTLLYTTTDGGTSWTPTRSVNVSGPMDCPTIFNCFVFSGTTIAFTSDSGSTWSQAATSVNLSNTLRQIDFVSTSIGFALSRDASGNTALYRTQDGGITWSVVQ